MFRDLFSETHGRPDSSIFFSRKKNIRFFSPLSSPLPTPSPAHRPVAAPSPSRSSALSVPRAARSCEWPRCAECGALPTDETRCAAPPPLRSARRVSPFEPHLQSRHGRRPVTVLSGAWLDPQSCHNKRELYYFFCSPTDLALS